MLILPFLLETVVGLYLLVRIPQLNHHSILTRGNTGPVDSVATVVAGTCGEVPELNPSLFANRASGG